MSLLSSYEKLMSVLRKLPYGWTNKWGDTVTEGQIQIHGTLLQAGGPTEEILKVDYLKSYCTHSALIHF